MKKIKINKWVLTPHAVERILERNISINELQQLLTEPEEIILQGHKYILTKHFKRRTDNLIAAVVVEKKEHGLWLVVTVMVNFEVRK